MFKESVVHISTLALLMAAMVTFNSCSSPNTTTVSSESVRIVACPASTVTSVTMPNFLFQPNSVSIAVNDIVMWINNDTTAHTVTSGTPGLPAQPLCLLTKPKTNTGGKLLPCLKKSAHQTQVNSDHCKASHELQLW